MTPNAMHRVRRIALTSLLAISLGGCSRLGSSSGGHPPQDQPRGKQLYDQFCAMCHDATELHLLKDPPKLDGLFQKQTLPSGASATDKQVRNTILRGRGIMPPFEQNLDSEDLNDLLCYLHTR